MPFILLPCQSTKKTKGKHHTSDQRKAMATSFNGCWLFRPENTNPAQPKPATIIITA